AKTAAAGLDETDFDWLTDGSSAGDWRLPSWGEWPVFVNDKYEDPALSNATGTGQWQPDDAFINVQSGLYWSGYGYPGLTAIAVDLGDGGVGSTGTLSDLYLWPVRSDN
ncbi:MAG: DUF1566 domain-containing protein, partial [Planctomycetes bacterium]|nr:DUF1566 domain-containing protein [Planctomycetota bacterium]